MPTVSVRFTTGPLGAAPATPRAPGAGARVVFEGVVRPTENGRAIHGLEYDVYRRMAERVMHDLAVTTLARHRLSSIDVEHSEGFVAAGAVSFRLTIDAPHRKEALAGADEFIDVMKREVPIWKRVKSSP
ncbi:MAG: molybdenum cofactor biosynthesis protein MoaE [Phycisphaerae bacterium]|nr:molybdenum cofactor biosynthesis protein MoaE [Phycisphaerae bacterium]